MTQEKQKQREFSAGILVADGLAEIVEGLLEDLGPTGLLLTGIMPLANLIRGWGKSNKFVTHGLDAVVRTAIRAAGLPPPLREFLTEFSDAYFDRVKTLAGKPKEDEAENVKRTVEEGKHNAFARLSDFIAKYKLKLSFTSLVLKLDDLERFDLFQEIRYLKENDPKEFEAWNSMKELIASLNELKLIIKSAEAQTGVAAKAKRMMEYLRFLHDRNSGLIDNLKAFVKGEETPQIKSLAETLKDVTVRMNKQAETWHERAEAIRARRRSVKK